MVTSPAITVVARSNAQLRSDTIPSSLDDPEGIAGISPEKRSALLSNPLLGPDDEPVQLLAAVDGRVAGRIDLLAGDIDTPNGAVRCVWGSSLYVSPAFRGRRLGVELLRASHDVREAAGVCAPSRLAQPIYTSLEYLDLPLLRFILVRNATPLVEHWLGDGVRGRAAQPLATGAVAAHRGALGLARRVRRQGLRLEPCEGFPEELEPHLRPVAPFSMHRSAAWLDWLVRERFSAEGRQQRALHLVRTASGEVVAYLVVKARVYSQVTKWQFERLHLGSLIDWRIFAPRAVTPEQLALLALEAAEPWDVEAFEICVPPGSAELRPRRLGFAPAGVQHVMLRGRDDSVLRGADAKGSRCWSVRPGEGDHGFS